MSRATIDHRSAEMAAITLGVLAGLRRVFRTEQPVVIHPASGSGGWESALVNTLSPGDRVLMFETGQFALGWADAARRLGLDVEVVPGDWRCGADPDALAGRLGVDAGHGIKAVAVLHNETSTGVLSRVRELRRAMDEADHPALLMVDTISSLASEEYAHDAWGVDVTVAASQKGFMLPPGLAFVALSQRAREASRKARLPRSYWDWERMLAQNAEGFFPYTPATNMLFGLRESLAMLEEEGLERVVARHARLGDAARAAVQAWGLEVQAARGDERSNVLTAVRLPDGHDAERFRSLVLERFNMALGAGFGKVRGRVFRIGHLGDVNDLMLLAALAGVESGLALSGVPFARGGVDAAMRRLEASAGSGLEGSVAR
jgi:alanine-glyoxylate transaminase/serine-glyoxylate transaminase/serine-pyruvate transaminase